MAVTTNSKLAFLEYALILLTLPFVFVFVFFHSGLSPEFNSSLLPIGDLFHPVLGKVLSLFCFIASLWVMSVINQQYKFAEYGNRSVFAIGFLFALLFPAFFLQFEDGLALLCMSLVMYFLLQVHNQISLGGLLFKAAFFLSIATLLNNIIFWFLIVLFISLFILRPFKLKEHLSILTGYVLPFFYFFGLAYLFDWSTKSIQLGFEVDLSFSDSIVSQIAYAWLIILSLISIFYSLSYRSKMVVQGRKQMTVLLLFFLAAVLLALMSKEDELNVFLLLLPFSIFYALIHKHLLKSWIFDALSIAITILILLRYFGVDFFA